MKKRIACIVQQYGPELYGGAELHCMRHAERLTTLYDVDVLTSCSIDYLTWADHYNPGASELNGVTIRRFPVSQERSWEMMGKMESIFRDSLPRGEKKRTIGRRLRSFFTNRKGRKASEEQYLKWFIAQGPTVPALIEYLKANSDRYDALIFFTYLYYPTVFGLDIAPEKSILIPLAHDEWTLYIPIFKRLFRLPASILYNTISEKRLANRLFHNDSIHSQIAGTWVDLPEELPDQNVKSSLKIGTDYFIYVGRVDVNKITEDDLKMFQRYLKDTNKNIKLVLVGNKYMDIPKHNNIMYLGFVDEVTKFNLIKDALFLYQPSRFESLSHVVLEAFAMKKPVLVHKDCEVMRDHIEHSKGGFYYDDYESYKHALNELIDNRELNRSMGESGEKYVNENYKEASIIGKFQTAIEMISNKDQKNNG